MVLTFLRRTTRHILVGFGLPALVALGALGAPAMPAAAATTFNVNDTRDLPDTSPGDGRCIAITPEGSRCTLRAAIMEANALPGQDTIVLSSSSYFLKIPGTGEDRGQTGDLDVTDDLEIKGAPSTIDAQWIDRVLQINGTSSHQPVVRLANLSLVNGYEPGKYSGGGLRAMYATTTLDHVVVAHNFGPSGGGIFNMYGIMRLYDSEVSYNRAAGSGGGIANYGTLELTASTVHNNTAVTGGGIAAGTGVLTLLNSTVSGNKANQHGGGIHVGPLVQNTRLMFTTIYRNTADADANGSGDGGGVLFEANTVNGVTNVEHSILGGNADKGGQAPDCAGQFKSNGYNLVQSLRGCAVSGSLEGFISDKDPMLGVLAFNGGATHTHAPKAGSPVIDAGKAFSFVDQRGVKRPVDGNGDGVALSDLGAVEVKP